MKLPILFVLLIKLSLFVNIAFAEDNLQANIAPDFNLTNAAGEKVSLADFKGNPVIVHFWATWCPYCKKLQPELNRLAVKYADQGMQVIAISFNEDEGAEPGLVFEKRGSAFPTLINGDAVAKQYGVTGTPTTFFIDSEGVIVWKTTSSDPNDPKLEKVTQLLVK